MISINYIDEIFDILSKGLFISSNSTDANMRRLYKTIDENKEPIYQYFAAINFYLEEGNEFFYFTRKENKVDLERKLEIAMKWIDIIDFLKNFDNAFGPGLRFSSHDLVISLNLNVEMKSKVEYLKRHYPGKNKHEEIIDRLIYDLRRDGFIELENEIEGTYKVLSAFNYIEKLVLSINIPEEIINEIPE
ncbi:MAG: condensin complex protein MksE [Bacteroidales bacterium]